MNYKIIKLCDSFLIKRTFHITFVKVGRILTYDKESDKSKYIKMLNIKSSLSHHVTFSMISEWWLSMFNVLMR